MSRPCQHGVSAHPLVPAGCSDRVPQHPIPQVLLGQGDDHQPHDQGGHRVVAGHSPNNAGRSHSPQAQDHGKRAACDAGGVQAHCHPARPGELFCLHAAANAQRLSQNTLGSASVPWVQHNRDVRSLIDKIPTEYRHDVTRMLEITVDESLNPEMARRARGGGIYGLVADGADLLVRLVTWILVTVFKKPAAGLMLSREEIAQLVGGVLQVLVVLQSCLFLYMVLGGRSSLFAHNSAPDVAQAVASCQAQAMQLEVVTRCVLGMLLGRPVSVRVAALSERFSGTAWHPFRACRDLAALHRLLASLAASQPSLVRAAAAALDMESAVFH